VVVFACVACSNAVGLCQSPGLLNGTDGEVSLDQVGQS
jgi:hypothetical protein